MCEYIDTFQRVEHKYLLSKEEALQFQELIASHIKEDIYPVYTLHNIYYDSQDSIMIMRSLMSPTYKEKLRLRSYGNPSEQNPTYVEIKKKYDGIVYKRRVSMDYEDAKGYLDEGKDMKDQTQIAKEIDYVKNFYQIEPKVFIAYDRKAFAGIQEEDVRITFDTNIRYRLDDLSLYEKGSEKNIIDQDQVLMEIKVMDRYPIWLVEALTKLHLNRTSFSKYGVIYAALQQHKQATIPNISYVKEGIPCLAQS